MLGLPVFKSISAYDSEIRSCGNIKGNPHVPRNGGLAVPCVDILERDPIRVGVLERIKGRGNVLECRPECAGELVPDSVKCISTAS